MTGDLRGRPNGGQVIVLSTTDGGALFRFTDIYSRMTGGQMTIGMDAPSADNPLQHGSIIVRDFEVHDEAQLQRAVIEQRRADAAQRHGLHAACASISTSRRAASCCATA